MKLDFLKLPPDERRLYIEQAAIQRNISPVIMEKDFFVCWLLSSLFQSQFADNLVFKGGPLYQRYLEQSIDFLKILIFRYPQPFLDCLNLRQIAAKLINGGEKLRKHVNMWFKLRSCRR